MKDDEIFLKHILDAIHAIEDFTKNLSWEGFDKKKIVQSAVVREIEVIGEAAKHVSERTKAKAPSIPWRGITGMRDMLIHEYFGVDLKEVWGAVTEDIPLLKKAIKKLLEQG